MRVKNVSGGTRVVYIFSGTKMIAEYENGAVPASPSREYVYSGSQLLATIEGATTKYHHADHLSARVLTDANGNSTGTCDYEPFGATQSPSGCSLPTNYRFAGMEFDTETQLYHTWFRQYDPSQGRWMTVDPLAGSPDDPQSLNRYAYVLNDPVNLIDPLGLRCWFEEVWVLVDVVHYRPVWVGPPDDGRWEWERYVRSEWQKQKQRRCGPELLGGRHSPGGDTPGGQPAASPNESCPPIPPAPSDADINKNVSKARENSLPSTRDPLQDLRAALSLTWFYSQVKSFGPWDYKRKGRPGEFLDFGNFNYGATGAALGLPEQALLRAAGAYQILEGKSKPEWGGSWPFVLLPPYGDNPKAQEQIKAGFQYKTNACVQATP